MRNYRIIIGNVAEGSVTWAAVRHIRGLWLAAAGPLVGRCGAFGWPLRGLWLAAAWPLVCWMASPLVGRCVAFGWPLRGLWFAGWHRLVGGRNAHPHARRIPRTRGVASPATRFRTLFVRRATPRVLAAHHCHVRTCWVLLRHSHQSTCSVASECAFAMLCLILRPNCVFGCLLAKIKGNTRRKASRITCLDQTAPYVL